MANYSYKGAIAFGLVYIPITLSVSVKDNDIGFNMIDKRTMTRIKYKKTCVDCDNREVKNEDIVKGYQYEKGKYVIFTDKDFEKIADVSAEVTSFADTALELGTTYYYTIRAYYGEGEEVIYSEDSDILSGKPTYAAVTIEKIEKRQDD